MVSLEWATQLGRAIPSSWYTELRGMSEEKATIFSKRFPRGEMEMPEEPKVEKKTVKPKVTKPKKVAKKVEEEE
jgi:hypothetical protein